MDIPLPIESAYDGTENISFSYHWETALVGAWGTLARIDADRMQHVADHVRRGTYSGKVTVKHGDYFLSGHRTEAIDMIGSGGVRIHENNESGTQYIALSARLGEDWQAPSGFGLVLQLHGNGGYGAIPSFALHVTDHWSVYLKGGDLDLNLPAQELLFSDGSLNLGGWVDFVMKINFASDETGTVDVWRRDEGEAEFTQVLAQTGVATLQYKTSYSGGSEVLDHYWQHGIYTSEEIFDCVVWLDCITRGLDFDSVVNKAWG